MDKPTLGTILPMDHFELLQRIKVESRSIALLLLRFPYKKVPACFEVMAHGGQIALQKGQKLALHTVQILNLQDCASGCQCPRCSWRDRLWLRPRIGNLVRIGY